MDGNGFQYRYPMVEGAMRMMKKAIDLAYAISAPTVALYIARYYSSPGQRNTKGRAE